MSPTQNPHAHEQMAELAYPKTYIPYPLRNQVNQIDPHLDLFWQDYLHEIYGGISPQERKNVAEQILVPKQIFWNAETKRFEYRGKPADSLEVVLASLPSSARHIFQFGEKLLNHINALKTYDNVEQIADFLENMLNQILCLDAKNNLELQFAKHRLYSAFIYTSAKIIREKKELEIPENKRGLNASILKTYINEVFLKQQLLGYWFKTIRNRQLAQMQHPLLNTFLCREQKVRQLEIVRASKYLFIIAPVSESGANAFALRRFLHEETLFSNEHILLTGVAINTAMLNNADTEYLNRFKRQVENIITIESNISQTVMEFLTDLEIYYDQEMLPLLFTPIEIIDGSNIGKATSQRIQEYERRLTQNILAPLQHALKTIVHNIDESEYLYIGIRQLFGGILSTFKDFQTQPALLLNQEAEQLFIRLVAYTTGLEKRRHQLFTCSDNRRHASLNDVALRRLKHIILEHLSESETLNKEINECQSLADSKTGFLDKLFNQHKRVTDKLGELRKAERQMNRLAHQEITQLLYQRDGQVIHVEFDSLLMTNENMRHYAFLAGDDGLTRLPMIIAVPENPSNFDLAEFWTMLQAQMQEHGLDEEEWEVLDDLMRE